MVIKYEDLKDNEMLNSFTSVGYTISPLGHPPVILRKEQTLLK